MLKKILNKDVKEYKAKDVMTKNVITFPPSESLLKAQSLMTKYRIKKIVVVEDDIAVGIIAIKDILKFVISDQTDREMHEIPIAEAMIKRLVTTEKNSTLIECAQIMVRENVSSIVIIEEDAQQSVKLKFSGIITTSDFTNFFGEECANMTTVRDYMSYPVFTIAANEKISNAIELMLKNHISHLVVTGPSDLVGILSETDLLLLTLAFKSKTLRSVYENNLILFHSSKKRNLVEPAFATIRDVLTPDPTVIEKNADLADAAKIMIRQGISAIPIADSLEEEKKDPPVGIITKSDIVKALSQIYQKARPRL
jgi:CBS domain-containing protein